MTGLGETSSADAYRAWREPRAAIASVAFLTRLPVGRLLALDGEDVARAGPYFPLVGAAIGAAVGGICAGLAHPVGSLLAAGAAVAVGTLATGALHLDALADTADGLGGRSRERALAIMREHTIGSYGAVALVLALLLEWAALAKLTDRGRSDVVLAGLVAASLGRAAPVVLAACLPYARAEDGLARSLVTSGGRWRATIAALLAAVISVLALGWWGVLFVAVAGSLTAGWGGFLSRWLGGVTGDTSGATVQLVEVAVLVVAAAVLR